MKNYFNNEQYQFYFKSNLDALRAVNSRAEEANNKYDDLVNKFDNYVVLSDSVDGRISQLVNISTNFGAEDPNDPAVKEFVYNEGSILRYKRILPVTHRDEYEVVNFKTLINLLTSTIGIISGNYVSKTGDSVIGDYTFNAAIGGSAITFDSVGVIFTNNTINISQGILQTIISNPLSLINKQYLENNYTLSSNLAIQPLFVSKKIAIHEDNDLLTVRSKGEYDITVADSIFDERLLDVKFSNFAVVSPGVFDIEGTTLESTQKIIYVKLLKFNAKATWDSADSSWTELYGAAPVSSIPGSGLDSAIGTIPSPVDYSIFLEYTADSSTYPYTFSSLNSRIRTKLPNDLFSAFIDSSGDLALIGKTNFQVSTPFSNHDISLNCNSSANPVLYLVVRSWSYIPRIEPHVNDSTDSAEVLLFGDKTWMRTYGTTGDVTVRYRLLNKNISEAIVWTDDTVLATTYGLDSIGYYVDIVIPEGETSYFITFTATYSRTLSKAVSLQLINYVYIPMEITPELIAYDRYNLLPMPYLVDFKCLVSGGQGVKSASIISDSDTTLGLAAITPTTYEVTGEYTAANVDEYVKVKIVDETYALTANEYIATVATISSSGTNVTIVGDTANTPQYSYIIADGQTRKIMSITNPTVFVIDDAFSPDLSPSTSFTIATKTLGSVGVNVTLTNDTIASTPIGSYITVGSETKRVVTTPTSNTLTIDSAFSTIKPDGTAYTIEVGQAIKIITIRVNELLDNPDETMGKYIEV